MKKLLLSTLLICCAASAHAEQQVLDRLIAVVNEEAVTLTELENETTIVIAQLKSQRQNLPSDETLRQQVLERLIMKHIQSQLAAQNNIIIDDVTLNQTLQTIAEQNRLSLAEFRQILIDDGFDFNQFREHIRHEVLVSRLRQRFVDNRINVSTAEVEQFLAQQAKLGAGDEEYLLSHILISTPEGASSEQIQVARDEVNGLLQQMRDGANFADLAIAHSDGQNALKGGDLGWRSAGQLPSLFAEQVIKMQVGDISEPIRSPSGFHLLKIVDKKGDQRRQVITQTHARHILIKTDAITTEEEARNKLAQLRERIVNGADFGELARAHSVDKGSAVSGGDLGWASPGQMVPRFEQEMGALAPGEISQPFESRFGWHIVQVLERREYDSTEESQRSAARAQLIDRKIAEEETLWLRRIREEAYVDVKL